MPVALFVALAIHGQVYVDTNRDGRPSAGEPPVPHAVVALDVAKFVVADAGGQFDLELPATSEGGIVWVRVPDGFEPGPIWVKVDQTTKEIDLGVRPNATASSGQHSATFIVAADTHLVGEQPFSADLRAVATSATALDPAPAFFTILGDITQGNQDSEFDLVDESLAGLGVPYVPVPGNHDWYDGGEAWLRRYGPDNYSFDLAGTHFVVWNMAMTDADIRAYLGAELAHVDRAMPVVALTHAPPSELVVDALHDLGVDYVLTGHVHANRDVDHEGVIELGTEPMLMGGLDFSPAGYRVVTVNGGRLSTQHRTVVDEPVVAIAAPLAGACAGDEVIVSAEFDASATTVTAKLDCGTSIELSPVGGWTWRAPMPRLESGGHVVEIEARSASGSRVARSVTFQTCSTSAWTRAIGGHAIATPVIDLSRSTVYVSVTDLGVVAIDLATGQIRWRAMSPLPVRGSPAIVDDLVVYARMDGAIVALDAATGTERWTVPLGGEIRAAPTADDHEILVGHMHAAAAITKVGAIAWQIDPTPDEYDFVASGGIAVGGGLAIGSFSRALGGVVALDRATGRVAWRLEGVEGTAVNATPVIAGDAVYIVNGSDEAIALDLATGAIRWREKLDPTGFEWGNAIGASPAFADGTLVVPTLYGDLVALDGASGVERWRVAARVGPLRTTHYRGSGEAGFAGSPAIDGDVVWAADASGLVRALDLRDGHELRRIDLGIPVLAGLAASDDSLIVATYDGVVRRIPFVVESTPRSALASCDVPAPRGCCDAGGAPDGASIVLALALLSTRARRLAHRW